MTTSVAPERPKLTPRLIKDIRTKLGLSQQDFADALDVSISSVQRWEGGRAAPMRVAANRLYDLMQRYNVTVRNARAVRPGM